MAIIKPKKATKTVNRTLSESMKTPAVMDEESHPTGDPRGAEAPSTSGTMENANMAVTKLTRTIKKLRALSLRRAIGTTSMLENRGSIQTNHDEISDNTNVQPHFL
jgi:hypothetical protein